MSRPIKLRKTLKIVMVIVTVLFLIYDFEVDTIRYPKPAEWFKKLQDNGYRVVLWMTTMVNSKSKDTRVTDSKSWFSEAGEKGYLAGKGNQIRWWKGEGGFIDYTNPEAIKWWHGLQQKVFIFHQSQHHSLLTTG